MICGCPTCQKQFTIQSPGAYTCDGCGNSFNAGVIPQSQPQPPQQINVSAMSHGEVKRICETMWTCTLWIIFTPIVFSLVGFLIVWLSTGFAFSRLDQEFRKELRDNQRQAQQLINGNR